MKKRMTKKLTAMLDCSSGGHCTSCHDLAIELLSDIISSVILTKEQAITIRDWDESANFENIMSDIDGQLEEIK